MKNHTRYTIWLYLFSSRNLSYEYNSASGNKAELAIDAKPIMMFRLAKARKAFPIVDIVYGSNSQFLGTLSTQAKPISSAELENPYYAAGQM